MNYYQEVNNHIRLLALNPKDFKHYLEDVKKNGWPLSHILIARRYFKENGQPNAKKQYLSPKYVKKLWKEIKL